MKEEDLVLESEGETAKVEIKRTTTCKGCGICRMGSSDTMIAEVENPGGAKVGDKVEVEVDTPLILKVAFIVYIFPIVGLIVGYLIGEGIFGSELVGICFGIGGLLLSFRVIYWYDKRLKRERKLRSKIIRIYGEKD